MKKIETEKAADEKAMYFLKRVLLFQSNYHSHMSDPFYLLNNGVQDCRAMTEAVQLVNHLFGRFEGEKEVNLR